MLYVVVYQGRYHFIHVSYYLEYCHVYLDLFESLGMLVYLAH